MRQILRRIVVATLLMVAAAPALSEERKPGPLGPSSGPYREQEFFIAWDRADRTWLSHAKIFRPQTDEPRPLVLIAHGSPRDAQDRLRRSPTWADRQARWFAAQGFVVAVPLRRGYGKSDGPVQEGYGECEKPNFHSAGLSSANDIQGVLGHMVREPYVDSRRMVLVGHSAGGWAALAAAARNVPGVVGIVNFAGGRGSLAVGQNCAPDRLVESAGRYGATARIPTLWIYAENDTYIGPNLSRRMFEAFQGAGGSAEYHLLRPFGKDGHALFAASTGLALWMPIVTDFLRTQKLMQ